MADTTTIECPLCKGSGELVKTDEQAPWLEQSRPCTLCRGAGQTTQEAITAYRAWLDDQAF